MDVSYPMGTVVPSLDGGVLQALAGSTAPIALTRVQQLAGAGSLSGVRKVLLRLVSTGLVEAVPGGYVLNRDHVAAPPVEQLAGMRREIFRRIRDHVAAMRPQPLLVGVFGSFARGDGDADSDIDILVVTSTEGQLRDDGTTHDDLAADLSVAVRRWTGNSCHVVVVTSSDLQRMRMEREPVMISWQEDLVVVLGDRKALKQ